MNCSVSGQQKEIETLKETIANLTKQLSDKDKEQVRVNSALSSLRDELEVHDLTLLFLISQTEKAKNSQISSQYLSLQFKLAQEKATKTIKSTAASISSSIKSFRLFAVCSSL